MLLVHVHGTQVDVGTLRAHEGSRPRQCHRSPEEATLWPGQFGELGKRPTRLREHVGGTGAVVPGLEFSLCALAKFRISVAFWARRRYSEG